MNLIFEVSQLLTRMEIPFEVGHYSEKPPNDYVVIIPLSDSFGFSADDNPQCDVQEVRLALYTKGNFTMLKQSLTESLLDGDFTITERRYVAFEADTQFHHLSIDVKKVYPLESEG